MPPVPASAPSVAAVGGAVARAGGWRVGRTVRRAGAVGRAGGVGRVGAGGVVGGQEGGTVLASGLLGRRRGRRGLGRLTGQQDAATGRRRRGGLGGAGPAAAGARGGRGRGGADPAHGHDAEAELRLPLHRVDEVASALAGDLDHDVLVALGGHLGLGDAGAVDTVVDDVRRLAERLGGDVVAGGGEADPGATLEVQPERRLPRTSQRDESVQHRDGDEEDRQGAHRAGGATGHVSAPRGWCRGGREASRGRRRRGRAAPRPGRPSSRRHRGRPRRRHPERARR